MPNQPAVPSESTLKYSKIILGTLLVIAIFKVANWGAKKTDPLPSVPKPNGYETLLTVAGGVNLPAGDLAELSPEAIRQSAELNRDALQRLHSAVRLETGVPLRTTSGWVDEHAKELKALKRLALALGVQSRAELLMGQTNSSAESLLDVVLLGHALARGGILSDGINSLVVETIGTASLRAQVPYLDAAFCRRAAQELERNEERRELPERILYTEKCWSVASFGLVSRVGSFLRRGTEPQRRAEFNKRYQDTVRRTRRLILMLAARAEELETGAKVENASALVPTILRSIPVDPETTRPLDLN